jgi:hypothetical protein
MTDTAMENINIDDEISLGDIINFFGRNWKLMGLTVIGITAITVVLSGLLPKQYQKELSLRVTATPIIANIPSLEINQTSNMAVEFVTGYYKPEDTRAKANVRYNVQTQAISLTLRSVDQDYLEQADLKIKNLIISSFESIIEQSLQKSLSTTQISLDKNRRVLVQLEQEINQMVSTQVNQGQRTATPLNLEAVAFKLESLETKRTGYISDISALEFEKQYLEEAQKNLTEFTSKVISVEILTASELESTTSLLKIGVLAAIASFMIAVFIAIIKEQLALLKPVELSPQKQEIDKNEDLLT